MRSLPPQQCKELLSAQKAYINDRNYEQIVEVLRRTSLPAIPKLFTGKLQLYRCALAIGFRLLQPSLRGTPSTVPAALCGTRTAIKSRRNIWLTTHCGQMSFTS